MGEQRLRLAFQSLGVVYGDLGTSPLYVFTSTFPISITDPEVEVIGALSLILYTLTLASLVKYVFIVPEANHRGEGGTFALFSLLCEKLNLRIIPRRDDDDNDNLEAQDEASSAPQQLGGGALSCRLKSFITQTTWFQMVLLLLTLIEEEEAKAKRHTEKMELEREFIKIEQARLQMERENNFSFNSNIAKFVGPGLSSPSGPSGPSQN